MRNLPEPGADDASWPPRRDAWLALGALAFAYALSYVDRLTLSFLVQPMKRDLGFSDTQVSLLLGFSFAVFYAIAGLPISRLADRASRRTVVTVGIAVWSVMTALCAFAHSFPVFFLARVGVGVGEACLGPAAISLIADFFPERKRSFATGLYVAGGTFGIGAAYLIGGTAVGAWGAQPPVGLAFGVTFYPWQGTFLAIAAPGLLAAIFTAMIREPARRGTTLLIDRGERALAASTGVLRFIRTHPRAWMAVLLGPAALSVAHFSTAAWAPTLFMRVFGWTAARTGAWFAAFGFTLGVLGPLVGGFIAHKLIANGRTNSLATAILALMAMTLPCYVLTPLVAQPVIALILYSTGSLLVYATLTLPQIAIQQIAPNRMRARLVALLYFLLSLLGLGIGPTATALLTDAVFADEMKITWSMAVTSAVFIPLACALTALGRRQYGQAAAQPGELQPLAR